MNELTREQQALLAEYQQARATAEAAIDNPRLSYEAQLELTHDQLRASEAFRASFGADEGPAYDYMGIGR